MCTKERAQLEDWFGCKNEKDLCEACLTFLEPFGLLPNDPLLKHLEKQSSINWKAVLVGFSCFPDPPNIRLSLMRYITGVLSFMRRATEPCGNWLIDPAKSYLMMERPAENAAWLNLFLDKPLPATPAEWITAAESEMGEWLPLNLLSGGSQSLTELIPILSGARLIENQQIQEDLDYVLRQPVIQGFSNLRDQVESEVYHTLQAQCDELKGLGLSVEQSEYYYTQVRLFFSSQPLFVTWQEADEVLRSRLLEGDPGLITVPAEFRRRLLDKALIQEPHDGSELALCPCTGLPLWKNEKQQWQTASRDPEIQQKVSAGILLPKLDEKFIKRTAYYRLHSQIIRDWYLPGQLELQIAEIAEKNGWSVILWPKRDQLDVLCEHPDSSLSLVIDGKDWKNAYLLGRSFMGFKSYSDRSRYLGLVVVPNYQLVQPKYRERFMAGLAHQGNKAWLLNLTEFRKLIEEPAAVSNKLRTEEFP